MKAVKRKKMFSKVSNPLQRIFKNFGSQLTSFYTTIVWIESARWIYSRLIRILPIKRKQERSDDVHQTPKNWILRNCDVFSTELSCFGQSDAMKILICFDLSFSISENVH